MSSRTLTFPVKKVGNVEWLDLTAHGLSHEFCTEKFFQKNDYSFSGGHRVRHFQFKKNVHWLSPSAGITLNIEDVEPETKTPPRRQQKKR